MSDSPAIFIRQETAALIASGVVSKLPGPVAFATVPHRVRGEMQGYRAILRYRCGNTLNLTDAMVDAAAGA